MFVTNLRKLLLPLLTASAFVVLCQIVSAVNAMCVYNNADGAIDVYFDCGVFCDNTWHTEPGNVYCRASESGTVATDWICCSISGTNYPTLEINVDAHGWVEMTQPSSTQINVCAYHQDGSSAGCQSFDPTS